MVLLPLALGIVALVLVGPVPQDPAYHDFADRRTVLRIPHFGDVASSVPFLLVGGLGLWASATAGASVFEERRERIPYLVFFAGVLLTAFGSAYYHWRPDSQRLFWDRLPMTLAFMSLFAIVVGERASAQLGARLLPPLLLIGFASVFLWRLGERPGGGDLRLYGLVQFYPMLAIPLLLILWPPRYTQAGRFWAVSGFYAVSKACELLDRQIFAATGFVSGHTLKHLFAALSALWLVPMLRRREFVTREE